MPDITISSIDKSLKLLLQTQEDFPGYSLDFCSGYITTDGILLLKHMLKTAPKVRAVLGLNPANHLSAFQMLRYDCQVEVYVYVTAPYTLFHPKVYLGTLNTSAWALVGSSNLTKSGLSLNIEQNLFIAGQRHIDPFVSIESQIAAFRNQAYLFDADVEKKLEEIEKELGRNPSERDYKTRLYAHGLKPKTKLEYTIPSEAQQVALEALFGFVEKAQLEHAYQMLLLLIMLSRHDENGLFSLEETAHCFSKFYNLRRATGLAAEKSHGSKQAIVSNPNASMVQYRQMLKTSPFPRFEREGLLNLSEDSKYFMLNPALIEALTPTDRASLRKRAIERIAKHFGEDEILIEKMVIEAIE